MKILFPVAFLVLLALSGCFLYQRAPEDIPYDGTVPVTVTFSVPSGFYTALQQVTLTCNDPGAKLYYTRDGSLVGLKAFTITPTNADEWVNSAALAYTGAVAIPATALLRVRAYRGEIPVSKEFARMYFINETTTLPVFSLVMNPLHLWDDYAGIYVPGAAGTANPVVPLYGNQNYFQDWERPAFAEFFDAPAHVRAFSMDIGVKIFGGHSRDFPQKSLALFARTEYGAAAFAYDFFGLTNDLGAPITSYTSLVLRNSGDDWYRTMFRDAFLQSLLDGMDVERQAYKPAVLFLNGQYWGIHNIREKINEDYLASHYADVDPNAVDILTYYDSSIVEGDNTAFKELLAFVAAGDLSIQANYNEAAAQVDIDNFIDYTIAQLYVNNTDWPFTNIKYWRPQSAGGKWRWIIYDLDSGFHGKKEWADVALDGPGHNSLDFLLSPDAGSDFQTLFVGLAENAGFKTAFKNRFTSLLAANFESVSVNNRINAMKMVIAAEIPRHQERWNAFGEDWATVKVQVLKDFANARPGNWPAWLAAF